MDLRQIDNPYTLNIFSDASIKDKGYRSYDGCYGAIAVVNNAIIDEIYRVASDSTNNNSEIKGIRAAVLLAIRYGSNYQNINIFSDSQISVLGIRERFPNWNYNPKTHRLYGYDRSQIKSQEVFIEILELIRQHNLNVIIWHQKGHVKNTFESLSNASHVFAASNRIREGIDLNLIRYISHYNNVVDKKSRQILMSTSTSKLFTTPVIFYPIDYNLLLEDYNKRNLGGNPYAEIKQKSNATTTSNRRFLQEH